MNECNAKIKMIMTSRIINWVRSSLPCSWSCGEWASQRIDLDWDESWFSLIIEREFDFIFLIWYSTAVDSQTVEGIEIWGFSLWAINRGNGSWIWEFSFKEALHFILISESELLVSFQNHKHVVNISVDITHQLQTFGCVGWCWSSGLLLTSVWTAVSTQQVSVIAFFSLFDSSISANCWSIVSTHWWLTSASPQSFNLTGWWTSIISGLVLIITLLSSSN